MKKKLKLVFLSLFIILLCIPVFLYADEIDTPMVITEDNETEDTIEDEVTENIIYDDLFVIEDEDYEMNELVDGNVYILSGGNVKISGQVNGNVYVLANGTIELTKDANIISSLYSCSRDMKISGKVYDIYAVVTNKTELTDSAFVYRDIRISSSDTSLRGTIYRNVILSSNKIDVKDENSELTLGGDFKYSSLSEIENLSDVVKYGTIKFNKTEEDVEEEQTVEDIIIRYVKSGIMSIIYVLIIYMAISKIAPKYKERIGKDIKEKGIVDFAIGLLSWIIGIIILVISIGILFTIAAPISLVVWTAMFVIIYISNAVFSISIFENIREKFAGKKVTEILALSGIALVVWALQQIPYIGGIVSFITVTTGVGLSVRNIVKKNKNQVEVLEKQDNVTE